MTKEINSYLHTYVRTTGQSVQLTQVWRARALSDMFFISPARCKRFIETLQASAHVLCCLAVGPNPSDDISLSASGTFEMSIA